MTVEHLDAPPVGEGTIEADRLAFLHLHAHKDIVGFHLVVGPAGNFQGAAPQGGFDDVTRVDVHGVGHIAFRGKEGNLGTTFGIVRNAHIQRASAQDVGYIGTVNLNAGKFIGILQFHYKHGSGGVQIFRERSDIGTCGLVDSQLGLHLHGSAVFEREDEFAGLGSRRNGHNNLRFSRLNLNGIGTREGNGNHKVKVRTGNGKIGTSSSRVGAERSHDRFHKSEGNGNLFAVHHDEDDVTLNSLLGNGEGNLRTGLIAGEVGEANTTHSNVVHQLQILTGHLEGGTGLHGTGIHRQLGRSYSSERADRNRKAGSHHQAYFTVRSGIGKFKGNLGVGSFKIPDRIVLNLNVFYQ